jgi:amino acid adenylation domain-containing protein
MQSITDQFRVRVSADPFHLAVASDDRRLTYREIDVATENFGHAVLRRIQRPGQRVVLLADQGVDAVVATLGILKAGAAYVPLDPQLSHAEIQLLIRAVDPALVAAQSRYAEIARLLEASGIATMGLDPWSCGGHAPEPLPSVPPESIAYIYFTSGSTGLPKGVFDSHRNVMHNVYRYTVSLRITENDRLTLLQAPHFSGTVSSLFGALLNGASVHPYDVRSRGVSGIASWMRRHSITIYHSVPFIFRQVFSQSPSAELRCIRLEGDRASRRDIEIFKRLCRSGTVLANGLGATECGLVRQWRIDTSESLPEGAVPIGGPVPDMEVVLLDDDDSEVAYGEVGEIAVRSRYLALGYWGQPELTAERFRPEAADPAVRRYRTGDLGRFADDGALLYLGRKERHAKILGRWMDLQPLENALHALPGVRDAVTAVQYDDETPCIVAYVVLEKAERFDPERLRRALGGRVSAALLPDHWIRLAELPLNDTLKVDRGKLPWRTASRHLRRPTGAGTNVNLEGVLCEIVGEVLSLPCVKAQDAFLSLGGDSLAVIRVNNRLHARFACELPLESFFGNCTVGALAAELRARLADTR